jgi:hypothetical protein
MRSMSKLTFVSIRAQPSLGEIFAERAFNLIVLRFFELERFFKGFIFAKINDFVLPFRGDIR